jgi:hypothetical protein
MKKMPRGTLYWKSVAQSWFVSLKNKTPRCVACPDNFGIPTYRNEYHDGVIIYPESVLIF